MEGRVSTARTEGISLSIVRPPLLSENFPDGAHQFVPVHGLDDEPQRAQRIGPPLRVRVDIACRHHDGRNMILLLYIFKKAQAAYPRHVEIGDYEREVVAR